MPPQGIVKPKTPTVAELITTAERGKSPPTGPAIQPEMSWPAWLAQKAQTLSDFLGGQDPFALAMPMEAPLKKPVQQAAKTLETALREGLGLAKREPITAYHGSPHDFDKFSLSKIGTGEGAQAYGHGLYFAENPEVAAGYKRALGSHEFQIGDKTLVSASGSSTRAMNQTRGETIAADAMQSAIDAQSSSPAQYAKDQLTRNKRYYPEDAKHIDEALDLVSKWQREGTTNKFTGKTYEVAINAHPDDFLDWDKPLSQQSEKVRKAVRDLMPDPDVADEMLSTNPTGESLLRYVMPSVGHGRQGAEDLLSEALKTAGIKGVRYLDQGSRNTAQAGKYTGLINSLKGDIEAAKRRLSFFPNEAKTQAELEQATRRLADLTKQAEKPATSNYVVFDDSIIDIRKKMALLLGLGSSGAAATQLPQRREKQ